MKKKCSKCNEMKCKTTFLKGRNQCLDCRREYKRDWAHKNRQHISKYEKSYRKEYPKRNEVSYLSKNITKYLKEGKEWDFDSELYRAVGCYAIDLRAHLNNNEYGLTFGDKGVDIDHIIPVSKADEYDNPQELNHYTNLQLLPSKFNRYIKDTKEFNEKELREYIFKNIEGDRVLVIGDLHTPFDLDEYLDHCIRVYNEFNCNRVVFIGDIIDNHYSSYHETDPDGMGGNDELEFAIERLQRYTEAFPVATVILGNHDRMVFRKAFSSKIPSIWIKSFEEVLNCPGWEFVVEAVIDDVIYVHGEGGTARTKYKSENQSVVQGHLHSQAYIEWLFNKSERKFAMQVGTGIDFESYAFAYAKAGKKPAISCGVVIGGKQAFLLPMEL